MSRERNMFWADQNNISIFFMLNKYVASVFFDVKGPRSLFSCYLTIPKKLNLLSTNLKDWSDTLKQLVRFCRRIVWVCWSILWGWRLKVYRDVFRTLLNIEHETWLLIFWKISVLDVWQSLSGYTSGILTIFVVFQSFAKK